MFKRSTQLLITVGLILALVSLIVGCGAATPTTAKGDLTPSQAAELVYHDLTFHGISVNKVDVTSCTFKDRNTALVDVTYLTADGKNVSHKAILVKENGQWQIEDHNH